MAKPKRVRLYSKKSWDNVLEDNKLLLEDFLLEAEANGIKPSTRYQYFSDIRGFFCYLHDKENNKSILDLDRRFFRNFYIKYKRAGASNARINRHQASLRELLQYAYENNDYYDYEDNQMGTIKGLPKESVREIVFLSNKEVLMIINHYKKEGDLQRALFFSLAYDSGGRRNELYQVEKHGFEDIDNYQTNIVIGKRGKEFTLKYSYETAKLAKDYLSKRGEDNIDSLWVTEDIDKNRTQVSYSTLYYWVISSRDILPEYKEFNAHSFRHSCLENLSNGTHRMLGELGTEKLDLKTLQALANHNSSETTELYLIDRSDEELLNMFESARK